jgi:predicted nucleic acid-binding protein
MANKYLVDTNIFLEILLGQEKEGVCIEFLNNNKNFLCISDFSLYSIGLILYKFKRYQLFDYFLKDIIRIVDILHIPASEYFKMKDIINNYKLDFDDSYQLITSIYFDLSLVTLDKDFKRIGTFSKVIFL